MADIFVGSVAVGVVPDARGWNRTLAAELVPSSSAVGEEVGRTISKSVTDEMGKGGTKSADAFGSSFRKRLEAALKALPDAEIDANSSKADKKVAELRKRMEELLSKEIGVDLSSKEAMKEIALIDTGLEEVRSKSKDIRITFDTKEARAQLALLRNQAGAGDGKQGFVSKLGGVFGGAGAIAPAATGGAPAAAPAGGGLAALAGPAAIIAAIVAALAALPFLAQAAAGAIVFAFGGAFAAIGVIGAIMTGKLTKQWDLFQSNAKKDIEKIGQPFVPVLQHILAMAGIILDELTPVFEAIMHMIAGPFQAFVDAIMSAFTSPAVINSMKAVAGAFVSILNAFTPDIPGIAKSLADAISGLAHAISANPKAFADFLNFLFQIVIFAIRALQFLTEIATYIEQHFTPAMHRIAVVFDGVRHEVAHIWDIIFNNTIGATMRINQGIQHWLNDMFHDIAHTFDLIRHYVASAWDTVWNNTIGRIVRGAHDVEVMYNRLKSWIVNWWTTLIAGSQIAWNTLWNNTVGRAIRGAQDVYNAFINLKNRILSFVANARSWLVNAGENVISGFLSGMASGMAGIGNWVNTHIVQPVIKWVKSHFGISSPASAMVPVGRNIVAGMLQGIFQSASNVGGFISNVFKGWPQALGDLVGKGLIDVTKLPAKALSALGSVAGKVGGFFAKLFGGSTAGGVSRWAGVVAQALAMLGLPLSLGQRVLFQMQTESGGNPNAINLTDINAQRGDPSRGLLQTIGSTFAAYHVPGTSNNIYDPLANVAAAINYARHVYGPSLMSGGMGMGSGHGYGYGTNSAMPGWAWTGERGPELIRFGGGESVTPWHGGAPRGGDGSAVAYHAHFDGLTGEAIEGHVRTAFTAMSLTQGSLQRQGRRS